MNRERMQRLSRVAHEMMPEPSVSYPKKQLPHTAITRPFKPFFIHHSASECVAYTDDKEETNTSSFNQYI
ncbi:hypothetical protein DFP93_12827 [Aneurinibacillus soli]|uniref:Uncharacterized protein n=1 Tax=Aneurinibacillus soli TaxID=1500254 RepID=A0A0U5AR24_9BACL|nr:hypothetical protein [Aneurinibacillus soli]PYE57804.1 hypothetical protein DFP93_12827 [Aneurinibacillus soli]BAU26241.1 hypothetical protein CB4_00351 [Aneurinibacillus soli]